MHSAPDRVVPWDSLVVTHPFHPLRGHRLRVRFVKRRGADVVFVCDTESGMSVTLLRAWTDRGPAPAGYRVSAAALGELRLLLDVLASRCPGSQDGER
ncbi:DUF5372 family protein [Streptomyces sp. NPDC094438]|uniref:DUF5372 family protein n=1 Tax=Streptomyces sp. NPDC094438 TaxID=3366061 RepID=UPI003812A2F1